MLFFASSDVVGGEEEERRDTAALLTNDYENKTLPSPVDFTLKAHTGSCAPCAVRLDFVSHNAAGGCSGALTATAARLLYERDPRVGAVTRCSAFLRLLALFSSHFTAT
ncbi:hypothetical protein EYF80_040924 [Liparis tanakae]|uniref:Uncharacterized protein n=1 Tax=Liparis tanakae TaxID=230148 RepID=A0A4Z2G5K9_9TELE|nr:hypothetical protein EYF80_040924 [Liparis tanakae]